MQTKTLLQKLGILVALFTFSATFFGGINTAAAQEPEVTGTPPTDAVEIPGEGVTTLPPEDCTFIITNESIPTTAEPANSDSGTSFTIDVTVNINNNGQVSVNSGGEDTAISAEPSTGTSGASKISEDFALVEAGCVSSAVGYPDASPNDPGTGTNSDATPVAEQPESDHDCTLVKESKLADGTTEKTLSCPAS